MGIRLYGSQDDIRGTCTHCRNNPSIVMKKTMMLYSLGDSLRPQNIVYGVCWSIRIRLHALVLLQIEHTFNEKAIDHVRCPLVGFSKLCDIRLICHMRGTVCLTTLPSQLACPSPITCMARVACWHLLHTCSQHQLTMS